MTVPQWIQIIGVLLAVVTVVVAAFGIALGIAAVFGWRGIKDEAQSAAVKAAKDAISDYLRSTAMRDAVAREAGRISRELLYSNQAAFPRTQSEGGGPPSPAAPIGSEYPEPNNEGGAG